MEAASITTPARTGAASSHIIADAIYKRITGEDGYFDTRVVYIAEIGPAAAARQAARASWTRTAPTTAS